MSYTTIPDITISPNFGTVNKIVWFNVNDTKGVFNVNLFITPSQSKDVNITIFNKDTKQTMYKKTYAKTADTTQITELVQINHIPGFMSTYYGIKNS